YNEYKESEKIKVVELFDEDDEENSNPIKQYVLKEPISLRPRRSTRGGPTSNSKISEQSDESSSSSGENNSESPSSDAQSETKPCYWCPVDSQEVGSEIINCTRCGKFGHPKCLQFDDELRNNVKTYDWNCLDCKVCSVCHLPDADVFFSYHSLIII
ncbi:MAG: Zinc finger protein ubi-d4, partial [Paramarteilia canceri]